MTRAELLDVVRRSVRGPEWTETPRGAELALEDDPAGDGVEAHLCHGGAAVQVMVVVTVPAEALAATLAHLAGVVGGREVAHG